jgi:hypothetical protein
MTSRLLILSLALLLAACDIPGMGPDPRIAQREADAKAIGGACRHAQRGIEDCYRLNEKASKTAVFEGWKDMDQYMRENKIEGQPPVVGKAEREEIIEDKKSSDAGKDKADDKVAAKK